jgi:hypothetical protein
MDKKETIEEILKILEDADERAVEEFYWLLLEQTG